MYAFLYIGLIVPNKNCYANSMENKEKFHNILSDYKEFYLRTNPESATYDGDYRFNDKLSDLSDKAEHAKYDSLRSFLLSSDRCIMLLRQLFKLYALLYSIP